MAVTNESIHAVSNATYRPAPRGAVRHRQAEDSGSLDDMRRAVHAALLDFLAIGPDESRLNVAAAGQADRPVRTADVVVADIELIHMDTPQQAARDLLRTCRPGGRIGIACPAPGSFLAEIHARIEAYTAPDGPARSRGFSGSREALDALFGGSAIALGARDRSVTLRFASAEHWLAEWQTAYAPLQRAFELIEPEWRGQFTSDLLNIAALFAEADEGKLSIRCDYLEFIVHKGNLH